MNIALIGSGKTGSKVLELHPEATSFNEKNPPTLSELKTYDIIISFLPGDVFLTFLPMLIESRVPVVTGSTGFSWPENFHKELKEKNLKWIRSHNFSLGMNLIKAMIEVLGKADSLYQKTEFKIHDIHHQHKVDSPSGTALSWQDWLGQEATITAERTGDVVGYHHLELDTPMEKIKIIHEAKDRAIFATGALWAAEKLFKEDKSIETGLNDFSTLVRKEINI